MKKYDLALTDDVIKETLERNYVDNKNYLESIIRLLASIKDNTVICIDGEWGSGKTFLVKQLEYILTQIQIMPETQTDIIKDVKDKVEKLEKDNIVFYYNAWVNDDHTDPLQSIIFSILNEYDMYKNNVIDNPNSEEVIRSIGKIIISGVSQKMLGIDANWDSIDNTKPFKALADEINSFEERKESFRKLLDTILKGKRMILIIDELDRCNPAFATRLLEVVKHFYDYEKITVIVVANNKQLQHTIKQQYGTYFDAYAYLDKFYDFIMTIDSSRSLEYAKKYLDFTDTDSINSETFFAMVRKYGMTLRECNKYKVLYDSSIDVIEGKKAGGVFFTEKERMILYCIILPIIYAFKIKDIDAYSNCINANSEPLKEALKYLNDYLTSIGHDRWLERFLESHENPMEERLIIYKIEETFKKMMRNDNYNKTFLNAIRCSL